MPEKSICVTKKSVNILIDLLDETIKLLDINNELLIKNEDIKRNHELRKNAEREKRTYEIVRDVLEKEDNTTFCLMTYKKSKKRESDEDVDISEVSEPRREHEEPGTMEYF